MTPANGFAEMKDSGILGCGSIPSHWETISLKYVALLDGKVDTSNITPEDTVSFVPMECVRNDKRIPKTAPKSKDNGTYSSFCNGDIAIAKVTPCFENGNICVMASLENGYAFGSSELFSVRPQNIVGRYLFYSLQTPYFLDGGAATMTGVGGLKRVSFYYMKNVKIVFPPLSEQSTIASYLDTQCARIDEIIAQAKASIEDYKQWKASIIYEAVTKGLDPNVEMKDSGIPCADEIPKSWTITRFGKIATVKSNLVNPKDYQSYKQISPENIEKGSGVLLDCGTVEESGVISGNHLFYKGQILYSKIRPTLNKVIIAPFDGLCSADMYPIDTDHCSRFILYLMLSAYFNEQVALVTGNRVKMPKINQNELSKIMVAIPSGTEEQQIAKYLDSSCSQIDVLIKEKQSLIDDLEAYKKSLIYEVVTGKRRVC